LKQAQPEHCQEFDLTTVWKFAWGSDKLPVAILSVKLINKVFDIYILSIILAELISRSTA